MTGVRSSGSAREQTNAATGRSRTPAITGRRLAREGSGQPWIMQATAGGRLLRAFRDDFGTRCDGPRGSGGGVIDARQSPHVRRLGGFYFFDHPSSGAPAIRQGVAHLTGLRNLPGSGSRPSATLQHGGARARVQRCRSTPARRCAHRRNRGGRRRGSLDVVVYPPRDPRAYASTDARRRAAQVVADQRAASSSRVSRPRRGRRRRRSSCRQKR